MSKTFRAVAMVLVLVLGTTGAASALGSRAGEAPSAGLFDRALGWMVSLVNWTDSGLQSIWGEGGYIDPNGEPGDNPVPPDDSKFGGYIDPNG